MKHTCNHSEFLKIRKDSRNSNKGQRNKADPTLNYVLNILLPDFLIFLVGIFSAISFMLYIFNYI